MITSSANDAVGIMFCRGCTFIFLKGKDETSQPDLTFGDINRLACKGRGSLFTGPLVALEALSFPKGSVA